MKATPTVRARITALATLIVLVVLVLAGIGLVLQQRRLLTSTLDESLQQPADEIVEHGEDPPAVLPVPGEDDALAQVVRGGVVVAASANGTGLDPVAATPNRDGETIRTVDRLPHEDSAFRVLVRHSGDDVVIVAGALDDIQESIATLIRSLLVAVPLVVAALAIVLWWLVGRTLRPVEAIRAEVAVIGGRDLHRRVPVPPGDDEVARLARTMNDMLDRVDDSARRQQQFVADASHELRSPLTRIRTELEVDLAHPADADLLATHASVPEETISLQHLADDLLHLARSDGGPAADPVRERMDLDDIVLRVARRVRSSERVTVDITGVGAAAVNGDRDQLTRLIGKTARHRCVAADDIRGLLVCPGREEVVNTRLSSAPVLGVLPVESFPVVPCCALVAVDRDTARSVEQLRQVHQVPGHERRVAAGEFVLRPSRTGVEVRRAGSGFPDPACVGLRGNGVADVLQAVEHVRGAVLNAVLVSSD